MRGVPMAQDFKILGINHVGLAPKDPAKARSFLTDVLGLGFHGDEIVAAQKTLTAMFSSSSTTDVGPRLEILIPDQGEGPIAAFLEKKGSGIHHIAMMVDSVEKAIASLKKKGVRLIDESPRPGAHQTRIAFIHPESTGGLLVELVEEGD
jgi:methylmalonyl-CoA/ethylmalonyl-CoA epimerase